MCRARTRPSPAVLLALCLAACTSSPAGTEAAQTAAPAPAATPLAGATPGAPAPPSATSGLATSAPATPGPATSAAATPGPATPGAPGSLAPSEPFSTAAVTLRSPDGEAVPMAVYVAADPEQRGRGLMEREDLPSDAGMVFLFPGVTRSSFYMYNTLLPLSIAFFDGDGRVVRVLDMDPCEAEQPDACTLYDPGTEYAGALEVNQGYFDAIGLREGWTVDLPADLPEAS